MKSLKFLLVLSLLFAMPVFAQEDLTESFSADGYSFQYPEGWAFESFFGQVIGSNVPGFLEENSDILADNQLNLFFTNTLTPSELDLPEDATLEEVAAAASTQITSEDAVTLTEPEAITGGNYPTIRLGVQDDEFDGALYLLNADGAFVGVIAQAKIGQFAQFESTVEAIIATLEYDASQATDLSSFGSSSSGMELDNAPAPALGNETIAWQVQAPNNYDAESFGTQNGLSEGPDGTLYIADSYVGIITLSPDGTIQSIQKVGDVFSYDDVAIAADATLWITDTFDSRLVQVDAEGNVLSTIGEEGTGEGQFGSFSPKEVKLDAEGNFYVFDSNTDEEGNTFGRVQVFAPDGSFVRAFQTNQDDDFGFSFDARLALAPNGNIFVADTGFDGIRVFDAEGNVLVNKFAEDTLDFVIIGGMDVDAEGNVYVITSEGLIYKFDAEGNVLTEFAGTKQEYQDESPPFALGEFYSPTALKVLSDGSLIILDTNYNHSQIVRLTLP